MPRKEEKNSFDIDDRPSRFLVDLNPVNPFQEIEQPKEKWSDSFFSHESEEEKIEYTEPLRGKPEPTKRIKTKNTKPTERLAFFSLFRLVNYLCYKLGYFVMNLLRKTVNFFMFPANYHFKKRRASRIATPGSRALMSSSYDAFSSGINSFTRKRALAFAVMLFVLVLPLKGLTYVKNIYDFQGKVLGASEDAAKELKGAAKQAASMNFEQATRDFSNASNRFVDARNEIKVISKVLSVVGTVIPNNSIKLAKNADLILESGRLSADIGSNLTMAFSGLAPEKEKNIKLIVNNFLFHTSKAAGLARQLDKNVSEIQVKYLPEQYQPEFTQLKEKSSQIASSLGEVVVLIENMKVFLGFEYDKRYLLVFQNNTELRASGGFIGSYALVDFRNGEINNLEVPGGGSYDTEAGLRRQIVAPEALHLVQPLWHFWDSNWWPDWPTTARKLMWFYEKSDGPSVDGVISFTPTMLEAILDIIGPVDMTEKHDVVITADNFWLETQRIAEEKPVPIIATTTDKIASTTEPVVMQKHEPKKIIGDLMNKIIKILPERLDKDMFINLAGAVEASLNQKHILFYFTDKGLQQKTVEYGWDGGMRKTAYDYLMVVNTNVAGGKTDRVIRESITHKAEVAFDGSVIDTVTIKREHTGEKEQEFTGVRNNDWMRVYVPLGSELIQADGFSIPDAKYFHEPGDDWEIDPDVERTEGQAVTDIRSGTKVYADNGKTVFANWSQVNPGQTVEIILQYRLPFIVEKQVREDTVMNKIGALLNPDQKYLTPYALMVQKQPGSIGSKIKTSLSLHPNYRAEWHYQNDAMNTVSGWIYDDVLETDKYWATLLDISDESQLY